MRIPGEYLLGILLIVLGAIFLFRQILNIHIPIFRIVLGLIFIYIGVSILIGGFGPGYKSSNSLVFSKGTIQATTLGPEYNLIFSNGVVDLTKVNYQGKFQKTKINIIFSNGIIMVNPDLPAAIKVNSAFANADMPNNSSVSFGNNTYTTNTFEPNSNNHLEIDASVVFGKLRVIESNP